MTRARTLANYYAGTTTQVDGMAATQVGGFLDGGLKSAQFTPTVGSAYDCDASSTSWTVNIGGMTTPQVGQEFVTNKFGNFPLYMNGTVNGQPSYVYTDTDRKIWRYTGTSWGWN